VSLESQSCHFLLVNLQMFFIFGPSWELTELVGWRPVIFMLLAILIYPNKWQLPKLLFHELSGKNVPFVSHRFNAFDNDKLC